MKSDYFLLALTKELEVINVDLNYIASKHSDKKLYTRRTYLAYIDYLTSIFTEEQFKTYLYKIGKITSLDTDIIIAHKNGKYITEHALIYNDEFIPKDNSENIFMKKLLKEKGKNLKVNDVSDVLETFMHLYNNNEVFRQMIESDETYIVKAELRNIAYNYNEKSGCIFLKYKDNDIDYRTARDMIVMIQKYKKYRDCTLFENNRRQIKRQIVSSKTKILKIIDKDIIPGQLSFGDLKNSSSIEFKIKKEEEIKLEAWDGDDLKAKLEDRNALWPDIRNITLEDQLKSGMISYSEFRRKKEKEKVIYNKLINAYNEDSSIYHNNQRGSK